MLLTVHIDHINMQTDLMMVCIVIFFAAVFGLQFVCRSRSEKQILTIVVFALLLIVLLCVLNVGTASGPISLHFCDRLLCFDFRGKDFTHVL